MKHTRLLLPIVLFLASCARHATPLPLQTFTPEPTATQAPLPAATQTSLPTPTITPSPTQVGGGSGRLIFELERTEYAKTFPDLKGKWNIFIAKMDGTELTPITDGLEDYNYLESISPDGTKALIVSTSKEYFLYDKNPTLYLVNLTSLNIEPARLANIYGSEAGNNLWITKWLNHSRIVFLGQGPDGYGIYAVNIDGTNLINIYKYNNDGAAHKPFGILAIDNTRIYWFSHIQTGSTSDKDFAWWSSIDGTSQGKLEYNGNQFTFNRNFDPIVFSADAAKIAWVTSNKPDFPPHYYLNVAMVSDIDKPDKLDGLHSPYPFLYWRPDGSKILVFDYYPVLFKTHLTDDLFGLYEVSMSPDLQVKNFHRPDVLDTLVPADSGGCMTQIGDFSPDGRQILVSLPDHVSSNGRCIPKESLLNLEDMTFTDLLAGFTPYEVHWIP